MHACGTAAFKPWHEIGGWGEGFVPGLRINHARDSDGRAKNIVVARFGGRRRQWLFVDAAARRYQRRAERPRLAISAATGTLPVEKDDPCKTLGRSARAESFFGPLQRESIVAANAR